MTARSFVAASSAADVQQIAEHVAAGAVLVYPTDTLYGLGGRALDEVAVFRVFALKGREGGKPLPLVAADEAQAAALAAAWPTTATRLARRFWPGPLTLVVPARAGLVRGVASDAGGVAVRVPAHAALRALCARLGPLVATSANRSGEPAARRLEEVPAEIAAAAAMALDGGALAAGAPSTIVDLCGTAPVLIREGAVAWNLVSAAFP